MATRKLYKVTRENKKDESFAPQAQAILDTIKANGEPVERAALLEKLEKSQVLKTKQTPARVFAFFRPKLVEAGILKEIKEVVPDAEKPAKAAASEKKAKATTAAPKAGGKGKKTEQAG